MNSLLDYTISTDIKKMDFAMIHRFLSHSYWAKGIPENVLMNAMDNSLCFGLFKHNDTQNDVQVAFARMITDKSTFAYLADVFVLPDYREQNLSTKLLDAVISHPDLQGLRRLMLATLDAHGLYEKYDFKSLDHAETFMQKWNPDIYKTRSQIEC